MGSPPSQRKATSEQLIEYCFPNILTVQNCSLFDNKLRSSRILPSFKFLHSSTDLRSTLSDVVPGGVAVLPSKNRRHRIGDEPLIFTNPPPCPTHSTPRH